MKHSNGFLKQKRIIILLLISLAGSMAANLYFCVIRPLQKVMSEEGTGVWTENGGVFVFRNIQGGMGSMSVFLSRGLLVGPGQKFNVSVSVGLWEPYVGSATYGFAFKIYNRTLDSEYPRVPIVEKTVVVHKDKDAFYIGAVSGNLTVVVPRSYVPKIYIYKVEFENSYNIEFALTAAGGSVIPPVVPVPND